MPKLLKKRKELENFIEETKNIKKKTKKQDAPVRHIRLTISQEDGETSDSLRVLKRNILQFCADRFNQFVGVLHSSANSMIVFDFQCTLKVKERCSTINRSCKKLFGDKHLYVCVANDTILKPIEFIDNYKNSILDGPWYDSKQQENNDFKIQMQTFKRSLSCYGHPWQKDLEALLVVTKKCWVHWIYDCYSLPSVRNFTMNDAIHGFHKIIFTGIQDLCQNIIHNSSKCYIIDFGVVKITDIIHNAIWNISNGFLPMLPHHVKRDPCTIICIAQNQPYLRNLKQFNETASLIVDDTQPLLELSIQ